MRSKISLLPQEFVKRKKMREQMVMIVTIVILFAFVLSITFTFVFGYKLSLQGELNSILEQKNTIMASISRLKKYEDMDNKIKNLEKLLSLASQANVDWGIFFERFGKIIPGGISLTDIRFTNTKGALSLSFRGVAKDASVLSVFLTTLKAQPDFYDVVCPYTNKKKLDRESVFEFELSAGFKPQVTSLGNDFSEKGSGLN